MSSNMKTIEPTTEPLQVGRMVITCESHNGVMVPKIEFEPVGMITQGWFDRHTAHFQRAIQRAQVEQRQQLIKGAD